MRRRTALVSGIAIAVIVLAGAYAGLSAYGNNQKGEYLVAQVYITSWNSNISMMNAMDVQFKISLDLNNDGTYEVQQYSDIWNNTYIQQTPFRLGGPVVSNQGQFNFKIEAFEVANGMLIPLNYTADGSIPVNHGSAAENSQDSWHFDATTIGHDDFACAIDYMYFVS
jgi:hypothetical protein